MAGLPASPQRECEREPEHARSWPARFSGELPRLRAGTGSHTGAVAAASARDLSLARRLTLPASVGSRPAADTDTGPVLGPSLRLPIAGARPTQPRHSGMSPSASNPSLRRLGVVVAAIGRLVLNTSTGSVPRRSLRSSCPCPVSKRHLKNLLPVWDRERVVIVAPLLFQLSGAHYCPVAQPQVQRHCVVKSFFRLELDQNRSGARKDRVHQCACNSTNVRTICALGRRAEPKGRKGGSNGEVVRLGGKGCATPEWSPAMRWVCPISCTNQKRGRLGSQVYGRKGVLVARDRCPELECTQGAKRTELQHTKTARGSRS